MPFHRSPAAGSDAATFEQGKSRLCKRNVDANRYYPVEMPKRTDLGDLRPSVSPEERLTGGSDGGRNKSPGRRVEERPFDLCPVRQQPVFRLRRSLLELNREKRMWSSEQSVLKSGMVLLKRFLLKEDQVDIVKECRDLGFGPGGFYEPSYIDGAKLHLKMMCLGKNWDPQTHKYHDVRLCDGAKPPEIPQQFKKFVANAMHAAHYLIRKTYMGSAEDELPNIDPDLCIVNFYSANGKLGLHQDLDESHDSLRKRLPVISFSIGDSADFQYSDSRHGGDGNTIKLDSGDVLIFGGKSRFIFHGVSKIHSGTAPDYLHEDINLRPGRLNLTFRQY